MGEHNDTSEYAVPDPGTWLGMSIASTVCCTPIGIVGIVYAAMAMDARGRGDIPLMAHRVRRARIWTIVSVAVGLLAIPVIVALELGGLES